MPNRRRTLRALVGAPTILAIPATAGRVDRDIVEACYRAIAEGMRIEALAFLEGWTDDKLDAACEAYRSIVEIAIETPARSRAGWAAKARLLRFEQRDKGLDDRAPEVRLMRSLVNDLALRAQA